MKCEEAKNLKSFKNYCNCGGFAWNMNGRNPLYPHDSWCPQKKEHNEWIEALLSCEEGRKHLIEECFVPEKYIDEQMEKNL